MLYRRKKNYLLKDIAGDFILIARGETALEVNGVYVFNETGALLWNLLEQYNTISEIANVLVQKYKIDKEQGMQDVQKCIEKMIDSNLIDMKDN